MPAPIEKQFEVLTLEIVTFLTAVEVRHRNNFWIGRVLILIGISLAAGSVILGLYDEAKLALVLAILAGSVAAIDSAFAVRDVSEFQRIIASETKNILSPLKVGSVLEADFPLLQNAFYALRKNFDQNLPKGTGMEAVKKLMDDLSKAKKP